MEIKHNSKVWHLGDLAFSFCDIIPCLFSQVTAVVIFGFIFKEIKITPVMQETQWSLQEVVVQFLGNV